MATDVVMPQMGESIAEGTIVRWIKKVGDKVDRDEPLFEISTDKVDAEIPAPTAGVLTEIRVQEGETVPVNSVVAVIGQSADAAADVPVASDAKPSPPPTPSTQADGSTPTPTPESPAAPTAQAPPAPAAPAQAPAAAAEAAAATQPAGSLEDLIRQRSSPLVRKIARE